MWLLGDKLGGGPPEDVKGVIRGKWTTADGAHMLQFNRFFMCKYSDVENGNSNIGSVEWNKDSMVIGLPPITGKIALPVQQVPYSVLVASMDDAGFATRVCGVEGGGS